MGPTPDRQASGMSEANDFPTPLTSLPGIFPITQSWYSTEGAGPAAWDSAALWRRAGSTLHLSRGRQTPEHAATPETIAQPLKTTLGSLRDHLCCGSGERREKDRPAQLPLSTQEQVNRGTGHSLLSSHSEGGQRWGPVWSCLGPARSGRMHWETRPALPAGVRGWPAGHCCVQAAES